jgi:hypothetical protein
MSSSWKKGRLRVPALIPEILLWLVVINLGIAYGAGLYEARIVVPQWLSGSPRTGYRWNRAAALQADVGLKFWVYVTTVPLTILTVASLIVPWWVPDPVRSWWLGAALAALVDRVMTFGYFIPTMLQLMRSDALAESDAAAKALRWVKMGYVRHAATLIAWLAALRTFALLYAQRG